MAAEIKLPYVYDLTDITGKHAGDDRTTLTPLFKMQVKWSTFRAALFAAGIALPIGGLFVSLIGDYAIIAALFTWALCLTLLTWRSQGFGESMARTIYTRYRDKPGTVFLAGIPITFTSYEGVTGTKPADLDAVRTLAHHEWAPIGTVRRPGRSHPRDT